ncbi:MAG TPA: MarR family transcriptional regulator [Gemmatimonadales bacterium]|jgi:DNA-binding MarR family transcriptional regulator
MTLDQAIQLTQQTFPRVYFACHSRHAARRSRDTGLSARDADILAHLDVDRPMAPSLLARHLGRARSTVSEAIKRLEALGYVTHDRSGVRLTATGIRTVRTTSVFEHIRLEKLLRHATPAELARIGRGLDTLSAICRRAAEAP